MRHRATFLSRYTRVSLVCWIGATLVLCLFFAQVAYHNVLNINRDNLSSFLRLSAATNLSEADFRDPAVENWAGLARRIYLCIPPESADEVRLWRPDGMIVWSAERGLIGKTDPGEPMIHEVLTEGRILARFVSKIVYLPQLSREREYLRLVVPIYFGSDEPSGVLEVFQPAGKVRALILRGQMQTVALVLAVSLLLYLVLFGIVRRISRIEAEQRERLAEQDLLVDMGRVASQLAHEIKNPLFIIRGAAQQIYENTQPKSEAGTRARFVVEEADRLNRLLTETLSQLKESPPEFSLVDVGPVVAEVANVVFAGVEELKRVVDLPAEPLRAEVDPGQFRQVLVNLMMNAKESVNGTEGTVWIGVGMAGEDEFVVTVHDSGPGLDADQLTEAFKPFYSTKSQGSGLGLSVVRRIVRAHGGDIVLSNHESGGTEARVVLPIKHGEE